MCDDDFIFDSDTTEPDLGIKMPPWQILVVDDSPDVITVTKAVLQGCQYDSREIVVLCAYSAAEARRILENNFDIAVALIDVVMETDDAGLRLVTAIRDDMHLRAMRIILRTGQPGVAPEREVICQYDINDYRLKTELTAHSLFTAVIAGLRGFCEINARFSAEREVLQAARSKSEFLATISHELRTPLNAIIGFADIVCYEGEGSGLSRQSLEFIGAIKENGYILLETINRLISMASIDAGHYQLREEEIIVSELLDNSIASASERAAASNVTLSTQTAPEFSVLYGDSIALTQILDNLLSNAIKFSPHGGDIQLQACIGSGGKPTITVIDHGIGIPTERLNKLFHPFTQLDSGYNRHYEGIGLGLAIVKGLIALHGGTIAVDSIEGQGTKMIITLPQKRLLSTGRYRIL